MSRDRKRKPHMVEHEVFLKLSAGVGATVMVYAPKNASIRTLTRIAAIKVGLLERPTKQKKGAKQKHAIQRDETILD